MTLTDRVFEQLRLHEGLRLKPYRDTVGKLTIGIGRNLDDNGISYEEATFMCQNDIDAVLNGCEKAFPFWPTLNDARKAALADMAFNLGIPRLLKFKHMIEALAIGRFDIAASEMHRSTWAEQVGERANRLATQMQTGLFVRLG